MSLKTLSPYYYNVPLTNPLTGSVCDDFTAKFYIWRGSKTAVPAEPSYEATIINADGTSGTYRLNISGVVSDFIDFEVETETTTILANSDNQVWVKVDIYYNDVPFMPSTQTVQLATKGYGWTMEGYNPQLKNQFIQVAGDEYKVSRNGMVVLPILNAEPVVGNRVLTLNSFTFVGTPGVPPLTFQANVSANFVYSGLYGFCKKVVDSVWLPMETIDDKFVVPPLIAIVPFNVRVTAYDVVKPQNVVSNTLTLNP